MWVVTVSEQRFHRSDIQTTVMLHVDTSTHFIDGHGEQLVRLNLIQLEHKKICKHKIKQNK